MADAITSDSGAAAALIPGPVELVRDFVNSYEVDDDETEVLTSPGALRSWLVARELTSPLAPASEEDLALAIRLREALRKLLMRNHEGGDLAPIREELAAVASELPVYAGIDDAGGVVFASGPIGVRGGLSAIVAACVTATADGTWARLKVCSKDTCLWAYYDRSKNRSRRWCDMSVCGNRVKTASFRARHKSVPAQA